MLSQRGRGGFVVLGIRDGSDEKRERRRRKPGSKIAER
jgi:hypothetical protein